MIKLEHILFLILPFLLPSCQIQDKGMTINQKNDLLQQIWSTVDNHFYDSTFNDLDWKNKHNEYQSKIENCNDSDSLFALLNSMLFELNSSHCGVGQLSELERVASPYIFKNGEAGIDVRIINSQIIVSKVLKNSSAAKSNIKTGYIIEEIDGLTLTAIDKLTTYRPPFNIRNKTFHLTSEVLRHIYGQAGTTVKITYSDDKKQVHSEELTRSMRQGGISLGGGMPLAYLNSESYFVSKDIAYLSFNAFNPADVGHITNKLEAVVQSKGLIIDLRGNDGGSIEGMKLLLSRFVSERRKYGTYSNRNEKNDDFIESSDIKYQGKLVLLVDEMSISAAENMAGIVQQFEIGQIIGKQTPGQMLWGNGYLLNDSIALTIPAYKLEYTNGYNPENNGILPDIEIDLIRSDLLRGKDSQLEKAVDYLNDTI